jgi:amidohydrolase
MFDPKTEAKRYESLIIEWRRALHRVPEVHTDLPKTCAIVRNALQEMGYETQEYSNSGIRAVLRGAKESPVLAFRADMDALPIKEETGLPFASDNGNMHACGHDAHAAMLLGTAKILAEHKEDLAGSVIFLFQPAEETTGGAADMIREGCLKDPDADRIIILHIGRILPGVPNGCIGVHKGSMFAGASILTATVKGKGGHSGWPHECVDPIPIACEMVLALQRMIGRELSPVHGAVLTVTMIHSGSIVNVTPGEASFSASVRILDPQDRAYLKERIPALLKGIAAANRAEVDVTYLEHYPPVVNDSASTDFFADCARKVLGADRVMEIADPTMGAEDASYYLNEVPGNYAILGSLKAHADGIVYPHHNARFDIDESTLWIGTAVFLQCALDFCK